MGAVRVQVERGAMAAQIARAGVAACARAGVGGGGRGVTLAVPLCARVLSDQLTPVLAYRRLVAADDRTAPSFLLESVEGGERQGRYSILGAGPVHEVVAYGPRVARRALAPCGAPVLNASDVGAGEDPMALLRRLSRGLELVVPEDDGGAVGGGVGGGAGGGLPGCVLGGWFGCVGYDAARYAEPEKLGWHRAPRDDRALPDVAMYFFDGVTVFDHAQKVVYLVQLAFVEAQPGEDEARLASRAGGAYDQAIAALERRLALLDRQSTPLRSGVLEAPRATPAPLASNLTEQQHAGMVARALEYIRAGDIFQVVVGQRFERASPADPFDVYRALRSVNPSPYMVYMQVEGAILVASSPEILCRVRREAPAGGSGPSRLVVTNRPLAGTRRRGRTSAEDQALEAELRGDAKERAEHVMLVDLGRNDVGRVAQPGSIALPGVLEVERYSHVMHLSSTVTGVLREDQDCWDALAAALPVGTISGAPKVRAMEIIDELEPIKRGPYGGGMGYVGLDGQMDVALTLRTIVVPTSLARREPAGHGLAPRTRWMYHLQAAGGIVAESNARDEYQETVNKAAALARAIEVAERAFGPD